MLNNKQDIYFRKAKRDIPPSFIMDQEMLELLLALEDEQDLKKVSQKVQMPPSRFKKAFLKLVSLGLIEKLDVENVYAHSAIIEKMKYILNQIDGLLGDIILDDTAKSLGMNLDRIPLHDLAFFVENLSDRIPDEINRYMFKKWMFDELKAVGC